MKKVVVKNIVEMNRPKCLGSAGKYCGIDASLTGTGLGLLDSGLVESGIISTTPASAPSPLARYRLISDLIMEWIPSDVKMVCIEGFYVPQSKAQFGASVNLVGLGHIIRMAMHESGIPFFIASPSSVKKFVTGNGNASKDMMLLHVYKRFGLEFSNNNQADAFAMTALAYCFDMVRSGQRIEGFNQKQLDAVNALLKDAECYNL